MVGTVPGRAVYDGDEPRLIAGLHRQNLVGVNSEVDLADAGLDVSFVEPHILRRDALVIKSVCVDLPVLWHCVPLMRLAKLTHSE